MIARFPQVPSDTWRKRFARGVIRTTDGAILREDSRYRHGLTVLYRKEVPDEPEPIEDAEILYRDGEILVADKPHGMLIRPAGDHLARSLLARLQRNTGLATLAPVHQLDRDTAGLILFTIKTITRGAYHQLFAERRVRREYSAVAHVFDVPDRNTWQVENRMEGGEPWFRRRVGEGPVNAITRIELLDQRNRTGLFRISPETGKKHQIRVHMATIGFPIVGDRLYPEIRPRIEGCPPLQLVASGLSFIDPITGAERVFRSRRKLLW